MKRAAGPIILISILLLIISCNHKTTTPEEILSQIPIIDSFMVVKNDTLFKSTYEVWFRMPVDHNNPSGPTFPLRVYFSHYDIKRPVLVVLDGYTMYTSKSNELARILSSNQITIEHRFYSNSRPKDSIPWNYLNIKQAAADEHQIIQAFKKFYKGKWISTGISKSGETTIFHRRFYPKDVDVSVPYVAPLVFSNEDPRFYEFFKNVGTKECREKIYNYQKALFERKKEIFPLFEELSKKKGWEFPMGLDRAYDLSILEYQFSFWQWGYSCDSIPASNSPAEILFHHIKRVKPFTMFDDKDADTQTFLYQAMTEIGMYGYEVKPFAKYLKDTSNITFSYAMPKGHKAIFNSESTKDIDRWVKDSGNYILYIYGQNDPYTSTSVDPGNRTNAVKMVNPGGCHRTRIKDFPKEMRDSIYKVLEEWVNVDLSSLKNNCGSGNAKPACFPIL